MKENHSTKIGSVLSTRSARSLGRAAFLAFGCSLALGLTGCADLMVGAGGGTEVAYPQKERSIPPYKAWDIQFTWTAPGNLTIGHTVEDGKQMDMYVMTRAQDQRASAGLITEATAQPGQDYIKFEKGMVGQGTSAVHLEPGEYNVVFYNSSDSPVSVQSAGSATRD